MIINNKNQLLILSYIKKIIAFTNYSIVLGVLFIIQSQAAQDSKPIKLIYADSMHGYPSANGFVRELIGNVKLQQGDVNVKCDRALQYLEQNKAELIGNVIITQESMVLTAPHIYYDGNSNTADSRDGVRIKDSSTILTAAFGTYNTLTLVADFTKNVVIDDDSLTIYSDLLHYDRNSKNSLAFGNVVAKGKYSNSILTGDTLVNIPSANYTLALGKPQLFQIDTIFNKNDSLVSSMKMQNDTTAKDSLKYRFDTLNVSADTMEAVRERNSEKYYFKSNVELVKKNAMGKSDYAFYNKSDDLIFMEGKPIVWMDSTQLHGDSIYMKIPNKKLNSIRAIRNAVTASIDDTTQPLRINHITGDEIIIRIDEDTIRNIYSFGNAKSLYFASDTNDNSAARNSADSIIITFDKGEIYTILWLGGVEGEYFPENIINKNPKEYYLPLFQWSDNKPKKKILKLR